MVSPRVELFVGRGIPGGRRIDGPLVLGLVVRTLV